MPIGHYLELLWQYRRLVGVVTAAVTMAATLAAVAMLLVMPVYTASVSMTVLPTQAELSYTRHFVSEGDGGIDPAAVMMQTHIENLLSRPVAELTLDRLNAANGGDVPERPLLARMASKAKEIFFVVYSVLNSGTAVMPSERDIAIGAIQDSISVEWVQGSFMLRLSVDADEPAKAAHIANSLAAAYADRRQQVADEATTEVVSYLKDEIAKRQVQLGPEGVSDLSRRLVDIQLSRTSGIGQVRIIDPAIEPLRPSSPKVVPIALGGAIAGALLAVLGIIVVDTFGGIARTSMDMTRLVGSRFLGRVPPPLAATAERMPSMARLPLQPAGFATGITAGTGMVVGPAAQLWIHVVGIGGDRTARQGGIAIAAAYATSDIATSLILGPDERYRVRREGSGLSVRPLAADEDLGSGPVVTATPPLQRPSGLLAAGQEDGANQVVPGSSAPPRSLIVFAVAAGQVQDGLLSTLAMEAMTSKGMFLLVP